MSNTKEGVKKVLNIAFRFNLICSQGRIGLTAPKGDYVITVKSNRISLKAMDASLKEIVEELGRKTNIDVVAAISASKKITAAFENLSIEEAVERLSTNYSYVMDSTKGQKRSPK